ncbi:MAG: response regulator [Acidobacteriota bacterium]
MDKLEQIAGRIARAVGPEQSPEEILESAGLVSQLASELESLRTRIAVPDEDARKTVLLVEPDTEERAALLGMLERTGYAVVEAGSCAGALDAFVEHEGPIHLLLASVVMPDGTGRELTERAAEIRPGFAVLYLSAYNIDDAVYFGLFGPHAAAIVKPVTSEALARALADAFEPVSAR